MSLKHIIDKHVLLYVALEISNFFPQDKCETNLQTFSSTNLIGYEYCYLLIWEVVYIITLSSSACDIPRCIKFTEPFLFDLQFSCTADAVWCVEQPGVRWWVGLDI